MKKTLFGLLVLLPTLHIKAQSEQTTFKIKIDQEIVTYQFDSLKDFEENYETYLVDFEIKEEKKKKKPSETFWIEISVIISKGTENTTVTRSINSSEASLKEDTLRLKKNVLSLLAVL